MHARQALTALALAAIVAGASGCGAVINGTSRTIQVRSSTPGAEVYLNGGLAGPAPAKVVTGNAAAQVVTVHAPGHQDKDVILKPKVKAVPIVLDVLWCLTIIGVAAPISDGILGTFVALEPTEIDVTLDPAGASARTPVREFAYSPGAIALRAPAPAPAASKPVAPECIADKDCGAGRYCTLEGTCAVKKPKR